MKKLVKALTVNGKLYDKNWFSHKSLLEGEIINFDMPAQPIKQRRIEDEDFPYSLSNDK